jgi:hypothetical protein
VRKDTDRDGLTRITHEINGHRYVGWYRRLSGFRIEVITRSKVKSAFLGRLAIETEARRLLESLVDDDDRDLIV